jgi:hypothetical protein
MLGTAAVSNSSCEGQKDEITAGHECVRQTVVAHRDTDISGQRRVAYFAEQTHIEQVIVAKAPRPFRRQTPKGLAQRSAHVEFDPVALTIIEANRFHPVKPV